MFRVQASSWSRAASSSRKPVALSRRIIAQTALVNRPTPDSATSAYRRLSRRTSARPRIAFVERARRVLAVRQCAERVHHQRRGSRDRIGRPRHGERRLEPGDRLGGPAAHVPVLAEHRHEIERVLGVTGVDRGPERRPAGSRCPCRIRAIHCSCSPVRSFGRACAQQVTEVRRMRLADLVDLTGRRELLGAVRLHRLEHPVADRPLVGTRPRPATCRPETPVLRAPPPAADLVRCRPARRPPESRRRRSSDSRRATACSSAVSSSQLHSTTARNVWCRGNAVRDPLVSKRKRSVRRSAICGGVRARRRAAASSIASGIPSSRRQISAIASRFCVGDGEVRAGPRGPGRRTAGPTDRRRRTADRRQARAVRPGAGARPGCSAVRGWWSARAGAGQAASSESTRSATSWTRCSQLSSTSSTRRSAITSTSRSSRRAAGREVLRREVVCRLSTYSLAPSVVRIVGATSAASASGASSTNQMPSPVCSTSARPVSVASRVLPAPPGPTMVTSRVPSLEQAAPARRHRRPARRSWSSGHAGCSAAQSPEQPVLRPVVATGSIASPRSTATVEFAESGARVRAEFVGQGGPDPLVRRQGLGLAAVGVQGSDQEFVRRVRGAGEWR